MATFPFSAVRVALHPRVLQSLEAMRGFFSVCARYAAEALAAQLGGGVNLLRYTLLLVRLRRCVGCHALLDTQFRQSHTLVWPVTHCSTRSFGIHTLSCGLSRTARYAVSALTHSAPLLPSLGWRSYDMMGRDFGSSARTLPTVGLAACTLQDIYLVLTRVVAQ